ncbi:VMAP-C domain-containing protein [Streptomyces chryseus]
MIRLGATASDSPGGRDPVILSSPPDDTVGRGQLMAALLSGAPAIPWHRHNCSPAFRSSAQRLISEGPLSEPPSRISALHSRALKAGTSDDELCPSSHHCSGGRARLPAANPLPASRLPRRWPRTPDSGMSRPDS